MGRQEEHGRRQMHTVTGQRQEVKQRVDTDTNDQTRNR